MDRDKPNALPGDVEVRGLNRSMEIRARDDGSVSVAGYAAVFGEEADIGGMFTEVVMKGAFTAAIPRDDVVFLINHEGLPLARTRSGTLKLSEDDHGLYMEADLDASDPDVARIVPKMKRGDLDKMSFAFRPIRQLWNDATIPPRRELIELELFDVSAVTTPAYDGTEIALRSLHHHRGQSGGGALVARRMRMKAKLHGVATE